MNRILISAASAAVLATAGIAAEVAYEDLTFDDYGAVEQSLTGTAGDAENGAAIMTARGKGNCIACHAVTALNDQPFHGEVGPTLDGIASYRSEGELRGIVVDAKHTFPGSVMPSFYRTSGFTRPGDAFTGKAGTEPLPPLLTGQEIEDVVAFLMTLEE